MNPLKHLLGRATPPPVAADPSWIANDLQRYFVNGYLLGAFRGAAHSRFVRSLASLVSDGPRAGFHWEQKYAHTKDLRPSAGEYDASVVDVLIESGVPALLKGATGLDLQLAHVQIRVVYPGDSYMDWHRDTHYYGGRLSGSVPPLHKLIFYPTLGQAERPQLLVAPGSHRRVMPDLKRDIQQIAETGQVTVTSSDSQFLLFDTTLLHAVVPEREAAGSLRVIYAFGQASQLDAFPSSAAVQAAYRDRHA
jgi:hypothetical protein